MIRKSIELEGDLKQKLEAHYGLLLPKDKIWYTSKEAAGILGVSPQFIREAFDSQVMMGQEISATKLGGRKIKIIHRDNLLVYLMETANYTPQDFVERLKGLMASRSKEEVELVRNWLEVRARALRN